MTGVMTGRDDDATVGATHTDSELGGGCRCQSDIDHITAAAHQGAANHVLDHLTRDARVTTDDDRELLFLSVALCHEGGIGRYKLNDIKWIQGITGLSADGSTNT